MATSATTSSVYLHVIEDVISKVRDEFISNGGAGEDVLTELQGIWETKMMQAGVILGPADRSAPKNLPGGSVPPVHDLNVPYEGTEEYETPTADMLFPPTPLQTPLQTPLPGTVDSQQYNIPTGSSDYPTPLPDGMGNSGGNSEKAGFGRPSPYMQPPSPWLTQRPPLDVNVAYVEGRDEVDRGTSHQTLTQDFFMPPTGKRKRDDLPPQYKNGQHIPQQDGAADDLPPQYKNGQYIPQQDGAADAPFEVMQGAGRSASQIMDGSVNTSKLGAISNLSLSMSKIPQVDGPVPDPYDEMLSTPNIYNYQGAVTEDYNIANTPAPNELQAATPAAHVDLKDDDEDDDEPPLNENDDDDLDDVDQGEDLNTQHLVLAQFDKVTRTKSRWKCTLKDGIMHINDKDILFNKATGEFEF